MTRGRPLVLAERYLVLRRLGGGPRREVYLARDAALGGWCAVMFPAFGATDDGIRGFAREARWLAQVHHPGLATVLDVLDTAGLPAVVTELCVGSVARWVRRHGPLSPARAAQVGLQAADALAALHDAGLVHGPLSVGHLRLRADGSIALGHARAPVGEVDRAADVEALVDVLRSVSALDGDPLLSRRLHRCRRVSARKARDLLADALGSMSPEVLAGDPVPLPEDPFRPDDTTGIEALRDHLAAACAPDPSDATTEDDLATGGPVIEGAWIETPPGAGL